MQDQIEDFFVRIIYPNGKQEFHFLSKEKIVSQKNYITRIEQTIFLNQIKWLTNCEISLKFMKKEKIAFFGKNNKAALEESFLSDFGVSSKKGVGVSQTYTFNLQQKFK